MGLKDIIAGTYPGLGNAAGVPVNAKAFRDYLDSSGDLPKDIIAGTYAGFGNIAGVPANAEAFRDYLNYRSEIPKNSKNKLNKILATGAIMAILSGCPIAGAGGSSGGPNDDNGQDQPAPIEIIVSGLSGIVNDNYVDVRPDGQPISGVDINVSNGSIADVYWEQGSTTGNIDYVGDSLNFTTLPNTGYFDVLIDAVNNGDIETKRVSGLLAGPERAYFIGSEASFNSEYGSLDSFLETERFGGNIGDSFESQYLRDDVNYIFEGLPFAEHLADSLEFYAGKDSNGDHYILAIDENGFTAYEVTESEFNEIYDRNEEALVLG